jgi:P-type Ca2+ transporter type 2C
MATGYSLDDLTYVGIVGIIDPERPQVEKAIGQLHTGGVIVKMITGDAEKTAKTIGRTVLIDSTNVNDIDHVFLYCSDTSENLSCK